MVRDKVKNRMFDFLANTFHWSNSRTVSECNSVGGQNLDGVMYDVLQQVEPETEKSLKDGDDEWKRMVSLKFDAMQIGSKIKCNPRTMETVRF